MRLVCRGRVFEETVQYCPCRDFDSLEPRKFVQLKYALRLPYRPEYAQRVKCGRRRALTGLIASKRLQVIGFLFHPVGRTLLALYR